MENLNQIALSSAGYGRHEAAASIKATATPQKGERGETSLEPGQDGLRGLSCPEYPRLDTSVASRRFVLENIATGELRNDEFLTSESAERRNWNLLDEGGPWRWAPWGEQESEAA